jgi:hypothetical protein
LRVVPDDNHMQPIQCSVLSPRGGSAVNMVTRGQLLRSPAHRGSASTAAIGGSAAARRADLRVVPDDNHMQPIHIDEFATLAIRRYNPSFWTIKCRNFSPTVEPGTESASGAAISGGEES